MTGVILTLVTSIKSIWTAPKVFETSAQVGSSLVSKLFHGRKRKKSQNLMNISFTFVYVG